MKLVDRCVVTVTLDHDKVNSALYCGPVDLHAWLKRHWPSITPWFNKDLGWRGHAEFHEGAVRVEWRNTGLDEQVEDGDN